MIDYYCKFIDENQMLEVLTANAMTYTDHEGNNIVNQGGHQYAAWVVGTINGYDGYHYNLRLVDLNFDVTSLEPYLVNPQNPACVWA
jgi:hypothetical protein